MKKPDLMICWIRHVDFPLARQWIRDHREFFGKIIIYWSEHFRDMYLDKFMEESLKDLDIVFLQPIEYEYGVSDWRNIATTLMLSHSGSEWICSVEGDFLTTDWTKLLEAVTEASKTYDFLGFKGHQGQNTHQAPYLTGNYVHPAFWFMKRETLERTNKDFSADPKRGADHFGLITQDAERLGIPIWYTQDNGFPEETTFHLGGINHAYLNGLDDPNFVFHRPELFLLYNYYSMKADVPQDPLFMEVMEKMDKKLRAMYPDIDPETDPNCVFFIVNSKL